MITGVILVVIGLLIRLISILQMKKFYMEIREVDEIEMEGIYGIVRHPAYVGSIIFFAGLSFISVKLAVIYLAFSFFLSRAVQEEALLKKNDRYKDYMSKVGMFIPKFRKG